MQDQSDWAKLIDIISNICGYPKRLLGNGARSLGEELGVVNKVHSH